MAKPPLETAGITTDTSSVLQGVIKTQSTTIAPGELVTGGTDTPAQYEIPGDLGTTFRDAAGDSLYSLSLRRNAEENYFKAYNHRYRGAREAWKFNLIIQQLMALVASTFITLKLKNSNLKVSETLIMPTDTELAVIYHCREQVRFQEWIVQKDDDKEWFE